MKILILSDANNPHTIKWVKALCSKNIEVILFSLSPLTHKEFKNIEKLQIIDNCFQVTTQDNSEGKLYKIMYLKSLLKLKKIIRNFKPDILHAHYASSYGLLGALSGFHPFIISVWGSDVFSFPNKSIFHRKILEFNLQKADKILSTSHIMVKEIQKYTNKDIEVTPFGIDLNIFKPMKVDSLFDENDVVIGTVKTLEEKYGIEYLIKAFKLLEIKYPEFPLKLLIVGGGSLENNLKRLVKKLNIENKTVFTGKVSFSEVPKYHNMLSVFVSVSDSESFGVAVIEASACEKPVVVSDVGGLPEVVENGVTGLIVPKQDPKKTAEAIEKLILCKSLRIIMGKEGRERVKQFYNWENNVNQMINIYKGLLK